jgi:hypothetical protein
MSAMTDAISTVRDRAHSSGRFASVDAHGAGLRCRARDAAAEAWYVVEREGDAWFVALHTADRWLSESIEGDMLEGRDSAEELVDDELVEVGFPNRCGKVKHYRDDAKTYVFRAEVPLAGMADAGDAVATFLLAFEAAFGQLGDMPGGD